MTLARRAVPAILLAALLAPPQAGRAQIAPGSVADSVLSRRVSLHVTNATLADALGRLRHEQGAPLAYSGDLLPPHHRVTLALNREPLRAALFAVLAGSGLSIAVTHGGTVVIVARPDAAPGPEPLAADDPILARARMATGIRQLDQIVVMGTPVAGAPEREQASAVTVVGPRAIEESPHSRTSDLVRTLLPGVVLWDRGPGGPPAQVTSVRGVSSFTTRALKTYVDGIELASPDLFTLIDGRSVERIEALRGPQGAALYGPDALSGILQLITRKGQPGSPARLRATGSAGPYERPDLQATALWQDHAAGLSAGSRVASVELGGSFSQAGSDGAPPWVQSWTANAGTRALAGSVALTASARAGRYEYTPERITADGVQPRAPLPLEEKGLGVTAIHQVSPAWRQTLVAGHHWISGAREPERPTLLTPRLPLGATHETAWRTSLRYSSAWDLDLGAREGTLSLGAEHSRKHVERAVRTSVSAQDLSTLYDDELRSSGIFGQGRLRLGGGLILSAGTRAEWSSTVGRREGAAWASTVGASWSRELGRATLRLRGAWGRGLRPPEPGMSRAMATATVHQTANEQLSPERQAGLEAGAELYLADGAYARATWYHQNADDLIQQVFLRADGATARVYQFQNVGAIRNRGVELEAGFRQGGFTLAGQMYVTDSRVTRLAPGYTGELAAGDLLLEVPEGVGALSLRYDAGRVHAEIGASWIGAWTGYDLALVNDVAEGRAPSRPVREFWTTYPGVFRPYLALRSDLGGGWWAFARVDNPGKQSHWIRDNVSPPLGRSSLVGIELRP